MSNVILRNFRTSVCLFRKNVEKEFIVIVEAEVVICYLLLLKLRSFSVINELLNVRLRGGIKGNMEV